MTRNWWPLVCALMLHNVRAAPWSVFLALPAARALTLGVCGGRMCKQKYAAWKGQKAPGKGLEVGRVVPKWIPGDDYCTLLELSLIHI